MFTLLFAAVFGCVDVDIPEGAWYKRKGNSVTVGCDSVDLSWTVNCEGTEWKGKVGSCPTKSKYFCVGNDDIHDDTFCSSVYSDRRLL